MVDDLSYLNHQADTLHQIFLELPPFYHLIPDVLSGIIELCDRKWLYEYMGNVYLHFKADGYCGLRFSDALYNSLVESVYESFYPGNEAIESRISHAMDVLFTFFKDWERPLLQHFDRMGIPEDLLDYATLTCANNERYAQWNFFKPPF